MTDNVTDSRRYGQRYENMGVIRAESESHKEAEELTVSAGKIVFKNIYADIAKASLKATP